MSTSKAALIALALALSVRGADTDAETALLGAIRSEVQPPTGQEIKFVYGVGLREPAILRVLRKNSVRR
jgi:hypothetical protein